MSDAQTLMVQTCPGEGHKYAEVETCRGWNRQAGGLQDGLRGDLLMEREDMKLVDAREDAEVGRAGGGGFAVAQEDYFQCSRTGFRTFHFCDDQTLFLQHNYRK